MQYLLAAAQVSVLLVIWSRRMGTDLRWFTLSLLASLPIVFGYTPNSADWLAEVYYRLEPLALALRLVAGAEAMYRLLPERDRCKVVVTCGAIVFPVPVACWLISGMPALTFVLFRRYAQIFEVFALAVACLYIWRIHGLIGWRWGTLERHLAVVTLICANHAVVSAIGLHVPGWRYLGWYRAQDVSWFVAAVLYSAWTVLVVRAGHRRRTACQFCEGSYTSL